MAYKTLTYSNRAALINEVKNQLNLGFSFTENGCTGVCADNTAFCGILMTNDNEAYGFIDPKKIEDVVLVSTSSTAIERHINENSQNGYVIVGNLFNTSTNFCCLMAKYDKSAVNRGKNKSSGWAMVKYEEIDAPA